MDNLSKDSRFAHITKDVRFKQIPKKEKKVKIDKRFQSMFTDKRFQQKCAIDKRGRPIEVKGAENLEKYYDLSDDEDDGDEEEDVEEQSGGDSETEEFPEKQNNIEEDIINISKKSRKELTPEIRAKLKDLTVDYARGEGRILSDSSSDEEESEEEEDLNVDHDWGELDKDAETTEEATHRLAICNMDWDRITAEDLMVLIHSFLPAQGLLLSVTIYPSEFGLKRMAEEERKGPIELTESAKPLDENDEDEELTEEQREKLRQYQLKRLRYYYAVLTFDSARTANHVYKECDGLEYESSMNRLDLRFIPEDTTFEQEPKDTCAQMPSMSTYKPRLFRTTALTQVKVDLTWDETDPNRQDLIRSLHSGKCDDERLNQFLAASSSEEDDEDIPSAAPENEEDSKPVTEKSAINKYKALLADLNKTEESKKNEVSMEVTWDLKLEQKAAEKVKEAEKKSDDLTPFEKFLQKKKAKRKDKKEKKVKETDGDDEDGVVDAFSDDEIPSDIDMNDPYFKEEADKMDPKKKNKKLNKKKKGRELEEEEDEETKQKKAQLELLMMDEKDEGPKHHFSLKAIEENEKQSKRKKKLMKRKGGDKNKMEADNFKIDVKDDRFSAMYSSHLYNVDPAEPGFKPTEGMKAIIAEKQRRRAPLEPAVKETEVEEPKKQLNAELSLLVKSVKRKTAEVATKNKLSKKF